METIDYLFNTGVSHLKWLAELTGTTYQQINVIVYFIFIPTVWVMMLWMINRSIAIVSLYTSLGLLTILDVRSVQQMYDKGVEAAEWFSIIGWDYYTASVYTCVHFPIIVTAILLLLIANKYTHPFS